ncbi:SRPBCC family protein [Micromonospora sp. NPDC004540]|uniref:SRPBCC family protein n=1 Tax=Micromonospora sp. NPDC004540 TaxID=3154457 RepID=UPI00339EF3E2
MRHTPPHLRDNPAEASVTIERRVADVFNFYRDFRNLPRFLGDVMASEQIGPATFRWTIRGPLGVRLRSTVRLTEERTNQLLQYETASAPGVRTHWTVRFTPGSDPGRTEVHEVLKTPFGRLGRIALTLVGKPPAAEVAANLRRLKQLLETGEVTDTEHAVAGKFGRRPVDDHRHPE